MKHHKAGRTLGRKKGQRTALLRSLTRSLVLEEGITTTIAKAKELRPFVERLITASKANTPASRRLIASRLGFSPETVAKLHGTIAPRFLERKGGYTRIIRLGKIGKQATESARIEFVAEK
ncbi:MAG TPA: 50S ribosomal protein L17 [Candidatus Paceibacterota bacterium]|nr:50S ribosomal protein L17 [Candidatus Paceibacterota bacterium]